MHSLRRTLLKIDAGVFAVERLLLVVAVFFMTSLVFLDVVQRSFSRPVGKTASFLLTVMSWFASPTPQQRAAIEQTVGPWIFALGALLLCIAATQAARAMQREGTTSAAPGFGRSAVIGTAIFVGLVGVVQLLLFIAPSGIPGAQKFALGFLVWSGFLGASLATRSQRHIVLDAVRKKLSPDVRPVVLFIGSLFTTVFCWLLAYLSAGKFVTEVREWAESDGVIHVYESVPVPVWLTTVALPICFLTIGTRFLFHGVSALLFGESLVAKADEHGIDFQALEQQLEEGAVPGPSAPEGLPHTESGSDDASGRVYGRPHPTTGILR